MNKPPLADRPARAGALLAAFILALLLAACGETQPAQPPTPPGGPQQEAGKIDTTLRDLLVSYQTGGLEAARQYARNTGLLDDQDRVRFGLTLSHPAAVPAITRQVQKMGAEVYTSADERIGVAVDLQRLTAYFNSADRRNFFQELAAFQEVRELKLLLRPPLARFAPGPVPANEAVGLVGADRWQRAGYQGQGVRIGIIDGGFAGYRRHLGEALPPAGLVQFKSFLLGEGEGRENHGTLVAEIVHSLAPHAGLLLAPIEDEIGFTRAVQHMIESKVQIIQVSMGWGGIFPGDGTGRMNEKLDEARRAGILPVVAAGNYGLGHYMNRLNPDEAGLHRFGDGRTALKLTAEAANAWIALRWDEPWQAPRTNLDLYILDAASRPVASSRNDQPAANGRKPPSELAPFRATPGQTYYVQVKLAGGSGSPAPRLHLFAYNARLDEATAESSLATPGDARGALSIGATNWRDDRLEAYSSRGPSGDGRPKPDLLGPSGVSSRITGQVFSGTSAAAPQVAGAAALLWSAAPDLTADQVAVYLGRQARDLLAPGRDPESGFGRLRLGQETAARHGVAELINALPSGSVFRDDFRDSASGLPNNTAGYYGLALPEGREPVYLVPVRPGRLAWNVYLNHEPDEFRVEVGVRPSLNRPGLFYGLAFWQRSPEDYWAWLVSGPRYALFRREAGRWQTVLGWQAAAALDNPDGGSLRLSLEATALYLRLKVGETLLQTVRLKPGQAGATGGRLGLLAGQFEPDEAGAPPVLFSHLALTPLTTR